MSQKEEALNRLGDRELLELARSTSKDKIDDGTSRSSLIEIVKASFSLKEIKQKVDQIRNPLKTSTVRDKAFTIGGVGQLFLIIYGIASYLIAVISSTLVSLYGLYGELSRIKAYAVFGIIGITFFFVFSLLNMSSMVSLRVRFSGNRLGLIIGSIALAASILPMSYHVATLLGLTYEIVTPSIGTEYVSYNVLGTFLPYASAVLMQLTFTLIGVFFLVRRKRFPDGDISLAAGIVYIFAGSLGVNPYIGYPYIGYSYFSVFFTVPFLVIMAGAMGAASFLARKAVE